MLEQHWAKQELQTNLSSGYLDLAVRVLVLPGYLVRQGVQVSGVGARARLDDGLVVNTSRFWTRTCFRLIVLIRLFIVTPGSARVMTIHLLE